MITVSVLYPNDAGSRFDMNYYLTSHIPMVQEKLGSALRSVIVEQGLAGGAPGTQPAFSTICHLRFDSVEAFQGAFGPHAPAIQDDIKNYASVAPVIQISDMKVG